MCQAGRMTRTSTSDLNQCQAEALEAGFGKFVLNHKDTKAQRNTKKKANNGIIK